ncbi:MAG: GPW/gp25 family protein [Bacteroidia bacterium]
MQGKEHPSCTLKDSVAQRLHLILITNLNECRYDPEFGNLLWELDFENIPNITAWKDTMSKAIKEAVGNYEPRLNNVKAVLDVTEEELINKEKQTLKRIKKEWTYTYRLTLKKPTNNFIFRKRCM